MSVRCLLQNRLHVKKHHILCDAEMRSSMCDVLKEIYIKVYDESFDYDDFEKRIKMQKAVYLLENIGVHIGEYSFSWNKYGPYSLGLENDAKHCNDIKLEKEVLFSDVAEKAFLEIKSYISQKVKYTCAQWVECIASIHYLKNVFRISQSKLYQELVNRKPHLDDQLAFDCALKIVNTIEK